MQRLEVSGAVRPIYGSIRVVRRQKVNLFGVLLYFSTVFQKFLELNKHLTLKIYSSVYDGFIGPS